jgi:DNA-binding transcriptional regulator YhcF (GntR family)
LVHFSRRITIGRIMEVRMSAGSPRRDTFAKIYSHLRAGLAAGIWPPGSQVRATELAAELRTSATPVREAMSRLVGEGLLGDLRGQGYFVPRLQARDVDDLYSLSHLLTDMAIGTIDVPASVLTEHAKILRGRVQDKAGGVANASSPADLGAAACIMITSWSRSAVRTACLQRVVDILARVRAREGDLILDIADEVRDLADAMRSDRREDLRSLLTGYHARRRMLAADLCFLAYEDGYPP